LLTRCHPVVHPMWVMKDLQNPQILPPRGGVTSHEYQALNQILLQNKA
jgi:hypothetical protein